MAEQTPLYMDINNVYSGDEVGLPNRDMLSQGTVLSTDLAVTAGTGNTLNISAGAGWVVGDTDVNHQPNYRIYNDAIVNLGVNPDPTNPRYVRVVAQITDATFSGVTRNWQLVVIHGTPAGSPTIPAEPASAMTLATVLVPAAAASSAAYTITDLRGRARIGGTIGAQITSTFASGPPANPNQDDIWIATQVSGSVTHWVFQYDALAITDAYKWVFIGGAPYEIESTVADAGTANAWVQDSRTTYTTVRSGEYIFRHIGYYINPAAVATGTNVGIWSGSPPQIPWGESSYPAVANYSATMAVEKRAIVSLSVVMSAYWFSAAAQAVQLQHRTMTIIPTRIS